MFKNLKKGLVICALLASTFTGAGKAEAASMADYQFLVAISQQIAQIKLISTLDFDKTLTCYTSAARCARSTAEANFSRNDVVLRYARSLKCSLDLKEKLGRTPTREESLAACEPSINGATQAMSIATTAITFAESLCKEKVTACAGIPFVFSY